jgi:hypothetical protein
VSRRSFGRCFDGRAVGPLRVDAELTDRVGFRRTDLVAGPRRRFEWLITETCGPGAARVVQSGDGGHARVGEPFR